MSHWFHNPMGPCNATKSPWIHSALQDHNSSLAARGPVMQQWPLGSTKSCCFTPAPWDHAAQQCHNDVLGSMGSPQCHNCPLDPWCPAVSPWSLGSLGTHNVRRVSLVLQGPAEPLDSTRPRSVTVDFGSMGSCTVP